MGGKSRKTGQISKQLIDRLLNQSGKSCGGGAKKDKEEKDPFHLMESKK